MKTSVSKQIDTSSSNVQIPFLQLELEPNNLAVLPMNNAQEVLNIKRDRINPMPNMPDCVFGLINQRSRIFWLVDLPQLLGMTPCDRISQEYNTVIIHHQNAALSLVVPKIKGVIRLNVEEVQSPVGNVASGLIPYLKGCFLQAKNIVSVLDAEAIINSPILLNQQNQTN